MGKSKKPTTPAIRQGGIYILQNCPPLDDTKVKDRPIIVIDDAKTLKQLLPNVAVMACSTTICEEEQDRILMPTLVDQPQCKTGLREICWAVPRWSLLVDRTKLDHCIGSIGGDKLKEILRAAFKRVQNMPSSPPPRG